VKLPRWLSVMIDRGTGSDVARAVHNRPRGDASLHEVARLVTPLGPVVVCASDEPGLRVSCEVRELHYEPHAPEVRVDRIVRCDIALEATSDGVRPIVTAVLQASESVEQSTFTGESYFGVGMTRRPTSVAIGTMDEPWWRGVPPRLESEYAYDDPFQRNVLLERGLRICFPALRTGERIELPVAVSHVSGGERDATEWASDWAVDTAVFAWMNGR